MRKKVFLFCTLLSLSAGALAQSILDASHLSYVKRHLSAPVYAQAYHALESQAERDLAMSPVSVMSKDYVPSSGSKHDYVSLARYAWPDTSKPDGKPYIMKDGVPNPELNKFDRNKLSTMADAVCRLLIISRKKKGMQRKLQS